MAGRGGFDSFDNPAKRARLDGCTSDVQAAVERLKAEIARASPQDLASALGPAGGLTAVTALLGGLTSGNNDVAGLLSGLQGIAGGQQQQQQFQRQSMMAGGVGGSPYDAVVVPTMAIGWLKGRQGAMIQEIQTKSGVVIDVDQSMQDTGHCTVFLHGEQDGKKKAHGMIVAEIMKVATQPNSGMDCSNLGMAIQIPIDVSYVGWVKGPRGKVVQDVSNRSNTRVDIDQQMVPGTAVIKVFGTREGVAHAKELLAFEISKVSPDTAAQINSTSLAQLASGIMPPGSEQLGLGDAGLHGQASSLRPLPHERDTPSQFSNIIIPASYVGWLKGRQGAMIRDIESRSGAVIDIDQATKDLGHCTVNIMGGEEEKKKAYGLVVGEVMKVADQSGATGDVAALGIKEEIQIDASFVGWVKGPKGKVVQDISRRSCTRVDVEQPGNNPTHAFVKVYGTREGVAHAKELIAFEISKVSPETASAITGQSYDNVTPHHAMPPSGPSASSSAHAAPGGFVGQSDASSGALIIPASYVGWLKGRSGAMIRDIEARSGAAINIDQTTIDQGHCTVNIHGDEQSKKVAHGFVVAEVVKAAEQSGDSNAVANYGTRLDIRIESKFVGWVKGPRGKVVQDITARSATRVDVDQGQHDPGYATVKVYGTLEGVHAAKELVAHEISKVSPEAASEIMGGAPISAPPQSPAFRGSGGGNFGGGNFGGCCGGGGGCGGGFGCGGGCGGGGGGFGGGGMGGCGGLGGMGGGMGGCGNFGGQGCGNAGCGNAGNNQALVNLLANALSGAQQQQEMAALQNPGQPQANMNQLVQQLGAILGQGGFM
ncbi:unnamed protein product [Prorocentrum cordatum]|uniref:K Homology domain-containing protein n=1 Tax=Prorocentrum cordatum TaxID=2364126 RepID=A0ABN9QUM4_9DINO|nr:unnamed protein product [Polarella glacialis]